VGQRGHSKSRGLYFFLGKGNESHQLGTGFFCTLQVISAVKREELFREKMAYVVLRGRWCNIIVLNVHAASEEYHWGDPFVDGRIILRWIFRT
jgi:hypothetical protein